MLFVIKLFPEITIKSRPVRIRFVRLLRRNIRRLLSEVDRRIQVRGEWDIIEAELPSDDAALRAKVIDCLRRIPGIALFQDVGKYPLTDLDDLVDLCVQHYGPLLRGKTFVVRCKRSGKHDFRSIDVEQYVGSGLFMRLETGGVDLESADITVQLEIRGNDVFLVRASYPGLGGFPLGSQDGVLSLVSGGFDSAVSSFQCIRRGLLTHYLFFNLGGLAHELAVKEMALFIWMKYSSSHKVKFVTVPFEKVVAEILTQVDQSQMGVILKRMMLRAAERMASRLNLQALVTGEAIAQVSSQTLANLAVIDSVTSMLTLRPLITSDKQDIINTARKIGTEEFSRQIPEYCAVISVKPTTRARAERIDREEGKFNFSLLDEAVADARVQLITELDADLGKPGDRIEEISQLGVNDLLVDIRHPDAGDLEIPVFGAAPREILRVPFYRLSAFVADRDKRARLCLYCDKGIMSRLHAALLQDQGFTNVAVYRPGQS